MHFHMDAFSQPLLVHTTPNDMSAMELDHFIAQHARKKMRHRVPLPEVTKTSKLAHMLLELWAWGEISAYKLQQMAQASVDDG